MKVETKIIFEEIPEDKVRCRICGVVFKKISGGHLFYKHKLTTEKYLELFPDAQTITARTLRNYSKASKIRIKQFPKTLENLNDFGFEKKDKQELLKINEQSQDILGILNREPKYIKNCAKRWTKQKYYDNHKNRWVSKLGGIGK